jgi:recombinational DNA repair protein (RecF pathway)
MRVVAYAEVWMLRLAGTFPSTRQCMECGNSIARPLHFDDRLQGFVCTDCAGLDASIVRNDVADALETLIRLPVAEFAALPTPDDVLFDLRALAGAIRRHFLGHELKSFDVLASVVMQE